ncbi:MAG TPA: replication-associated recombination protein A [Chloroflexia bacterium]|nr:replication-associated recombination protein A [Chloroflexia bacterium]
MDLFDYANKAQAERDAPLAARMRPRSLDEIVGQAHLLGPGRALRRAIEADRAGSLILWGPPGSGKTTLARVVAGVTKAHFAPVSAVSAGVADLRKVVKEAQERRRLGGGRTILFIDEIHRFSKSQQDAILPYVEDGTISLIGATTENPSFEVNSALLSRARVVRLQPITDADLEVLLDRALSDPERGLGAQRIQLTPEARAHLIALSSGDARVLLNTLEIASGGLEPGPDGVAVLDLPALEDAVQRRALQYDKGGEQHYDIISALHKSVRDSDPDGSLYWLGRMLEAGEDPLFVARRLVRMAVEDIGLADPQALPLAMAAQQAFHFMGVPEGLLALAECAAYLALAPKSNAVYRAYDAVKQDVATTRNDPVPLHLRNAPTRLMAGLGYGKGYKYAHDYADAVVEQQHLPESLRDRVYYEPTDRGWEREAAARLAARRGQRETKSEPPASW